MSYNIKSTPFDAGLSDDTCANAGPILSSGDIYAEEQYRQRNMFHTVTAPSGTHNTVLRQHLYGSSAKCMFPTCTMTFQMCNS